MRSAKDAKRTTARLKQAALRVTAPRLLILTALEHDRSHPTAEELFARLRRDHPSLSLSTVYKTLDSFLQAGLCERVNANGSLRVDGVVSAHDHAVCRGCGEVFDVERRGAARHDHDVRLPRGLVVHAVRIQYDVVCAACRPQAARRRTTNSH